MSPDWNVKCLRYGRRYGVDPRENLMTFDKAAEDAIEKKRQEDSTADAMRLARNTRVFEKPVFAVRADLLSCTMM